MSHRSNGKSHRTIPDLMSAVIPGVNHTSNRNNLGGGPYRGAKRRTIPVPLMSQAAGFSNNRNNRFVPYSHVDRFHSDLEYRGPTHSVNRNQGENSLRSQMNTLSYSEALKAHAKPENPHEAVTLQISNLDPTIEEDNIRQYLLSQLKPITPVMSLIMETPSMAKVKVPSNEFAKQVVTHLHRKKVGHKRILVSYLKDPSSAETSALKCQITGLLKDVPNHKLQVYKFRELFQSRFKTSISILDLYRMQDVCTVIHDKNDERFIVLNPELVNTVPNPLIDSSQHSVPYCMYHFKQKQDKGWAELEIEPLPYVMLSVAQVESLIYELLKIHKDDVPVASLMYCIEAELKIKLESNENGVPLECLITRARGINITTNCFGIKVVAWMEQETLPCDVSETSSVHGGPCTSRFVGKGMVSDPLSQISREVVELVKMCPKAIMKFNRFIPAYHNHFGKQCRVADYGYTRLIDLFEALSTTVQVIGDGENRYIALTHRTQMRRFTTDLLKILRTHPNKSILLSCLPEIFTVSQNHPFDITEYGVCDVKDMLDGLVDNNLIVIQHINNGTDVLISIMKRQQTPVELEKTSIFAGETVELFRNAPQYSIPFKKFVRSYHYHFGYQCRLSDYGFTKLAELLEAITGVVRLDNGINDEDRKIILCQDMALRVFSEQLQDLIKHFTGKSTNLIKLSDVLQLHKNKYGYQLQAQTLGFTSLSEACQHIPFIEVFDKDGEDYIVSHLDDAHFRQRAYAAGVLLNETGSDKMIMKTFVQMYATRFNEILTEKGIFDMRHAVKISVVNGVKMISMTPLMKLLIRIGMLLEHETYLNVYEIKAALDISISTCFEMGYPNISSLIQAHPDLFTSPSCNNIHERSDIRLRPDCILTKKGLHMFMEQCRQYMGQSRASRVEHLKPKMPSYIGNQFRQSPGARPGRSDQGFDGPNRAKTSAATFFPDNQRYASGSFKQSFLKSSNQSSSLAYDRQNQDNFQIDHNNNSRDWSSVVRPPPGYMSKAPKSTSANHYMTQQSNLMHERRNSSELYGLSNLSRMFGVGAGNNDTFPLFNFSSYYEPPKPDTPPASAAPFAYDPVWSDNVNGLYEPGNMHSLNIHIPELTTVNIMPVIPSPCGHSSRAGTPAGTNGDDNTDNNNNNNTKNV